jgi:hypothetical protein
MNEFLSFRRMITPTIIQVLFWIWLVMVWLGALVGGFALMAQGGAAILGGLFYLVFAGVFGSIVVRVMCELIILGFQIHGELVAIRTGSATPGGHGTGFAPVMAAPSTGATSPPPPPADT